MKGRFGNLELESDSGTDEHGVQRFVAQDRDASYYVEKAHNRALAGDFERALQGFSAALGEDPLTLEAWVGQLQMLLAMGELPEVEMWSGKALERFPDQPRLLAARAVAMCRMGSRRDARGLCDSALKKSGEDPFVWLCRGEIILHESQTAARRCFDRVIALSSSDVALRIDVGSIYLENGLQAEAVDILKSATARAPGAARAWYLLGCAQRERGLATQARLSLEKALALEPHIDLYRKAVTSISREGFFDRIWQRLTRNR